MDPLGAPEVVRAPTLPGPIFPFFSAALLFLGFGLQRGPGAFAALSLESCSSELDRDVAVPETKTPSYFPRPMTAEGVNVPQPPSLQTLSPPT